jgi:hypothetical protein
MKVYAYRVKPESTCAFVNRVEKLGGFKIQIIKELDSCFLIIVTREDYYPYLTRQLDESEGVFICPERTH